ncbi:hypothetical protein [Microbulbifer variabilis]|uniref:hypothetical protein n=1 Tax=Microbulbifer variabilis TaxID=266805 RepID=UPI001CFE9EE5|nr:hypothetical protein [Microbulbifer variabilis]
MPDTDNRGIRGVSIGLSCLLVFMSLVLSNGAVGNQSGISTSAYRWQLGNANIIQLHSNVDYSPLPVFPHYRDIPTVKGYMVVSPFKMTVSISQNQYASSELLGIVIFRTIARDVSTSQRAKTLPIRHFDAVIESDFKPTMARKRYHRICDRKAPRNLSPCSEAQWNYRQAKDCLKAREDWEVQWGTPETAEPHERALENVRARVKNAEKDRRRFCEIKEDSQD